MKRTCEHLCATFQTAMDVLARPWCGLILATIEEIGSARFSTIGERIPQIGDRMLSARLKELEALGVVRRTVDSGPPVRVEYALTDAGKGFRDVHVAIGQWGETLMKAQGIVHRPPKPPRARPRKTA